MLFGRAPGHDVAVAPRAVLVNDEEIGQSTAIIVVHYLSQRAEQRVAIRPGDIVVSASQPEGDPDGVPLGGLGE